MPNRKLACARQFEHRKLDRFAAYYNKRRVHAEWMGKLPSSDPAQLCTNPQIFTTSLGTRTAPDSSTHRLLRSQEFATDRRPEFAGRDGDRWFNDTRIPDSAQVAVEFYRPQSTFEADRNQNPLDRGHLSRRFDVQWGATETEAKRARDDSFHHTNCAPQHYLFNQGKKRWLGLEDYVTATLSSATGRSCVINGPVFDAPLSARGPDGRHQSLFLARFGFLRSTTYGDSITECCVRRFVFPGSRQLRFR